MRRFVARSLLIAVGLCIGATAIHLALPSAPTRHDRRELLATSDSCQVLVIGPSYAGMLVPQAFDEEARRIGLDKRLCRLGRRALSGYELERELELVLAHPFPKLETVILDVTLRGKPDFKVDNRWKPRVVAWHTFEGMRWLIRYYSRKGSVAWRELPILWVHFEHLVAHYASVGRLTEVLGWDEALEVQEARDGSGVREFPSASEHAARLGRLLERRRERARSGKPADSEVALRLRSTIEEHGLEALFLHAPVWYAPALPRDATRGSQRLALLEFNDPEKYPELYTREARGNSSHLSGAGEPIYSRLLARALLARKAH